MAIPAPEMSAANNPSVLHMSGFVFSCGIIATLFTKKDLNKDSHKYVMHDY